MECAKKRTVTPAPRLVARDVDTLTSVAGVLTTLYAETSALGSPAPVAVSHSIVTVLTTAAHHKMIIVAMNMTTLTNLNLVYLPTVQTAQS